MIRVGFSTRKRNLLSRIIRWVTRSPISHAWLLIDHPLFRATMVLEASEAGFSESSYDRFKASNDIVGVFEPRFASMIEAELPVTAHLFGEPYDYAGLLGMLPVMIARRWSKHPRNWLASSTSLFCSEAVARILVDTKYPGFELDPSSVSPDDLYKFFRNESLAS